MYSCASSRKPAAHVNSQQDLVLPYSRETRTERTHAESFHSLSHVPFLVALFYILLLKRCLKPVLNWVNVCSPENTSDTSTNYDSFLN